MQRNCTSASGSVASSSVTRACGSFGSRAVEVGRSRKRSTTSAAP